MANLDKIVSKEPTLFPAGYGIRKAESVIVIDFLDRIGDSTHIISSIAMPSGLARELADGIINASKDHPTGKKKT